MLCATLISEFYNFFWSLLQQNDPLPGRIKVDFVIPKELPFGDKDTKSKVTLLEGDHVRFNISTDRRDKLERATNIEVLSDTFQSTNESREMVSGLPFFFLQKKFLEKLIVMS